MLVLEMVRLAIARYQQLMEPSRMYSTTDFKAKIEIKKEFGQLQGPVMERR